MDETTSNFFKGFHVPVDRSMQLEQEGARNIKEKVVAHRDNFSRIMLARYNEILPNLIKYDIKETNGYSVDINFIRMEVGLRLGYIMVIGLCNDGVYRLLGYTLNKYNTNNLNYYFNYGYRLKKNDIIFTIPKKKIIKFAPMKQITNDYLDGNFICVYNKPVYLVSDYSIIQYYVEELAEIVASRFSLSMQAKINTVIKGEPGTEDTNKIINDIYNGAPFITTSMDFDSDNVFKMDSTNVANNMVELKREYQNSLSELNNILGIDTVGVEKNSGVSDEEVNSNNGYVSSNANIYLSARRQSFNLLKKVTGIDIVPMFNDKIVSQNNLLKQVNDDGKGESNG